MPYPTQGFPVIQVALNEESAGDEARASETAEAVYEHASALVELFVQLRSRCGPVLFPIRIGHGTVEDWQVEPGIRTESFLDQGTQVGHAVAGKFVTLHHRDDAVGASGCYCSEVFVEIPIPRMAPARPNLPRAQGQADGSRTRCSDIGNAQ